MRTIGACSLVLCGVASPLSINWNCNWSSVSLVDLNKLFTTVNMKIGIFHFLYRGKHDQS